jgi:hypothetical protein
MTTRRALIFGAVSAVAGPPALAQGDPRPRSYGKIGDPAPPFALPKYGGGTAQLSDYGGRVLMLLFGGLWCPDCIVDGPHTNRLAAMAEPNPDIDFLYMQCGPGFGRWSNVPRAAATLETAHAAWAQYLAETGYAFPLAFDMSRSIDVARDYAIEWFPSFVIIDRMGVIRAWRTDLGPRGASSFFLQARRIADGASIESKTPA